MIDERTPGKLTRLRRSEAQPGQLGDDRHDHGPPTMKVQLGDILAGETRGRREKQHQPAVDPFTVTPDQP
jgi:hypothetical protein